MTRLHSKRVSVLATHRSARGPVLQAAPFSRWFHWEVGSCFTLSEGGQFIVKYIYIVFKNLRVNAWKAVIHARFVL